MKRVFISYPFSDNPKKRQEENRRLLELLAKKHPDILFISPLLLFSCYKEEDAGLRDEVMDVCREIIWNVCDELWSYGDSEGCIMEREYADMAGIKIERKFIK